MHSVAVVQSQACDTSIRVSESWPILLDVLGFPLLKLKAFMIKWALAKWEGPGNTGLSHALLSDSCCQDWKVKDMLAFQSYSW